MTENNYTELLTISGLREAEDIAAHLLRSEVACKVVQSSPSARSLAGKLQKQRRKTTIEVAARDLAKALAVVDDYRRAQGVPLN